MSASVNEPRADPGSPPGKRRSAFGRLWRGTRWVAASPFAAFPADQVAKNARLIRYLAGLVFMRPERDERLHLAPDRRIDIEATAFAYGVSVDDLELQFHRRRRETARAAYLSFGLAWMFFLLWLMRAATVPLSAAHLVPVLEFVPFCAAFFLMAFRSALQNYQLRTRTLATPGEYLRTATGFWPR